MKKSNKRKKDEDEDKKEPISDEDTANNALVVEIKPNWLRIFTLGFLISVVFLLLDVIGVVITIYSFDINAMDLLTSQLLQLIVFGEIGLIVLWGGCIGNVGQSVFINRIKVQLFGGRPMTKYTFRHATFHAFTYYFAGFLLLMYLISYVQIMRIIVSLS